MKRLFTLLIRPVGLILLLSLTLSFGYFGQEIAFEKQWGLYDSLRNTSAIIFGVMGAWVALIYPEALASIRRLEESSREKEQLKAAHRVLSAFVISACILSMVLIVGILAPIFRQIPWMISNFRLIRGISYATLAIMTGSQLWTILLTLLPADLVKRKLDQDYSKKTNRNLLMSQTQISHDDGSNKNVDKN